MKSSLKQAILQHAKQCYPRECCGVVIDGHYYPCRNIASDDEMFEIHHQDLADVEDLGEIQFYVHSHPDGSTQASDLDLHQIELHGKPWIICAFDDEQADFAVYEPFGYQAPLVGRNYYHGWQDCYSIVQDFYQREMGITLPNFERTDLWWEDKSHASLYLENFAKAGFVEVDNLRYGDVLLCRVGRTEHVNHAVIYLADNGNLKSERTEPCVGNALILHHPYGRKSVREIYGKNWSDRVVKVLRHSKGLMNE